MLAITWSQASCRDEAELMSSVDVFKVQVSCLTLLWDIIRSFTIYDRDDYQTKCFPFGQCYDNYDHSKQKAYGVRAIITCISSLLLNQDRFGKFNHQELLNHCDECPCTMWWYSCVPHYLPFNCWAPLSQNILSCWSCYCRVGQAIHLGMPSHSP